MDYLFLEFKSKLKPMTFYIGGSMVAIMAELELDIINGLTENMDMGNLIKFREFINLVLVK